MLPRYRFFGTVTAAQAEILRTLYELEAQLADGRFWRARDLGASRSSHHALSLRKLYELGLVERDDTSRTFVYRIAKAGQALWQLMVASARLPLEAWASESGSAARAQALRAVVA